MANLTISSDQPNSTEDDPGNDPLTIYELLGFGCSMCMIFAGFVGTVGSIVAIRHFVRRTSARSTVNVLLTALSTFDLLLLITGTPIYSTLGIYSFDRSPSTLSAVAYSFTVLYPISNLAQMGSVLTMTAISVERYLGVCRPFFARRELTVRRMRICVAIITFVSTAYNACRFWEYSVNQGFPRPLLRSDPAYLSVYLHWMYFIFIFCLPFSIIVIFNCLVAVGVRHAMLNRPRCQLNVQQRHERRTTFMLLTVVGVFLFCNCLGWPLNAYETFGQEGVAEHPLFDFLSDLNNLLILTHPLLNILVYMYFSRTFRKQCFPLFRFGSADWRASFTASAASSFYDDPSRRPGYSMTGDYSSHLPLVRTPTINSARTFKSKNYSHSRSVPSMRPVTNFLAVHRSISNVKQ